MKSHMTSYHRQPRRAPVHALVEVYWSSLHSSCSSLCALLPGKHLSLLLPKYFDDLGYSSAMYGAMIGVFILGGAVGTFVGGILGDRHNRRWSSLALCCLRHHLPTLCLYVTGLAYFVVAVLAGAFLNIPHSILLVMAQRLLPKRKGMVGGAVLGLMFVSGAVTAWIASWFADRLGLAVVLTVVALLPLGAGVCALVLPSTRGVQVSSAKTPATSAAD